MLSATSKAAIACEPIPFPPVTFRLPAPATPGGDPHFGFSRSYYYEGEKRGYWRLIRLRRKGAEVGVTLVPYDAVAQFVRRLIAEQDGETRTFTTSPKN